MQQIAAVSSCMSMYDPNRAANSSVELVSLADLNNILMKFSKDTMTSFFQSLKLIGGSHREALCLS